MPLTLEEIDQLLLTWNERLRRIDDNLIALEADPAYLTLIGPGERNRYDGASARKLREVQQELSSLFTDQTRLREVIDQARTLRSAIRGRLWGKDERLATIEGLLLGPSVLRGSEPRPLERRSLLDEVPHARSVTPELLLYEMVQRFENVQDALLSVWRAWQAVEPSVLRVETRLHAIDEAVARLGISPGSVEGLVGLRAEVSRLRTQVSRDPLGATIDLEGRLAPRFQIVEGILASLEARRRKYEEQLHRSREVLTALKKHHDEASARWCSLQGQIELGTAAARFTEATNELAVLSTALNELEAPGAWSNREALDRWQARAEELRGQVERLDHQSRMLLAAGPEIAGRFVARRAQIASFQDRGVVIPEEVLGCLRRIEDLLARCPLPVGRAASLLDLLDRAMIVPLLLLLYLPLLASCRKAEVPTEELFVVKSAVAPGLADPTKKKGDTVLNGHLGDVFLAQQSMGHAEWKGTAEGQAMERHGELLLTKRSPRDGMVFLFASDLAVRVPVPTSTWLCSTTPRPIQVSFMKCPEVLYRIVISPDTTVAYPPCSGGPCLLGLAHKDQVTWIDVENLLSVEHRVLKELPVLVVSRNQNDPAVNGLGITVFRASPRLPELLRTPVDVLDRSDPSRLRHRTTKLSFTDDALVLEGTERDLDPTTHQELTSRRIQEIYRSDGRTLKRF
jgi:hypothetical protein